GLALETAVYILNMVPSKSVETTPYEMWKGRKPNFSQFRIWGSLAHVLVQEAGKLEKCSEARVFVGYPKGMKDGLFYSPEDSKVIVSTNARFLEEDYIMNHKPAIMLKSIRILLAVAAHMDYEVWQMDVKTVFVNENLQEDIYMQQPEGFIAKGHEHLVCTLNRSIYGLKQALRSWNIRFDEVIQSYGFTQCPDEHCVYKKNNASMVVFLMLYVDDILLIGNSKKELLDVKVWLSKQSDMKDLGEAGHILGIRVIRDRNKRMLCLFQSSYIGTVMARFSMQDSKKDTLPFRKGIHLSKEISPKTSQEIEDMKTVLYASAVGSLMYAMLCARSDISYAVGLVARYQSIPGREHCSAVKHILKYLRKTKEYMLVYRENNLLPLGYSDSDFQSDRDESKSTSSYVFTLGGGAISWRSAKQKCVADSTMEAEYIAASEAAKEAIWLRNFLVDLEVITSLPRGITVYCDNSGA
ncbi:cysteine-rich RLK (RECEPTOR-like protein kinase) 8, partial [Striga hermonthica]